uniref:Uncharacterized protein n=2 Tax=Physcomitrium patens TaxID=3218 RepID=A0A2K1IFB7_PHYPA|nr:hypothetical protein PHYPA_028568 [Physcomitrium patens]
MPQKAPKPPPFWTDDGGIKPFNNLKARELLKTSLGVIVTVLGVKYETKARGDIGTRVLWVEYPNRFLAPLEKDMSGKIGGAQ